ncbi:MAG: hypothetical protein CVV57_01470 [Tenericutes bacterium HGW-Tenericutes-2]|jgi:hypothetical protein|nr:MAG: hypothetical protein CVV57_01470 [Tenericutes bacterium HGW-Tenericutes-2]
MVKKNAIDFINKGYIVDKKIIIKNIIGICMLTIVGILTLLIEAHYVILIIYLTIFLAFVILIVNLCSYKYWSFSNAFFAYTVELFFILITFNILPYYALQYLNSFSEVLFYGVLILQIVLLPIFLYSRYKIIQSKKNIRKYKTIPYISSAIGYPIVFFLNNSIEVPKENQGIVISLIFYIGIIVIIYYISTMSLKWFLSRKFAIDRYNEFDIANTNK